MKFRDTLNELFHLALPMVVSQGAFALMMFADRFFLSRLSPVHVAASLGGGVSFWVCLCFFNGLAAYANALVAQYYGRREYANCSNVVTQGLLMTLGALPLLLLLAWPVAGVFTWMGHEPSLAVLERRYFETLVFGALPFLIKTVLASYFSGIGRTRVVMIADVIGVALNVPLSYALIFGRWGLPEMGIVGAALGTIVAQCCSIAIYLMFYFNAIHRDQFQVMSSFHLRVRILRRYLRLGLPSAFEMLVAVGTFNVFLLLFQSYGVAAGAAMAIVFNWDMLSYVPLLGLNVAIMSLTGRSIGAGDLARAGEVIAAGFVIGVGYAGSLALVFVLFRHTLLGVFATPGQAYEQVLAIGAPMMIGMGTYLIADAVILVTSGVLRGAGDTRWLMSASILIHVAMLAIQVVVILLWQQPPLVSWWVFVCSLVVNAAIYLWRVLGPRWREPERIAGMLAD